MSLPRMVVEGAVYHVTKRCSQRMFLLKPSPIVNAVFAYCVARAAALFGVVVHAVGVESNHVHIVLTDPQGRISDFMHWLNRQVSKCLLEHYASTHPNRHLEAIWSKDPFSATLLVTDEAILEALIYLFTNCVKDALVRRHEQWPGLLTKPGDWLLGEQCFKRPPLYFRQDQDQFTHASIAFSIPSRFADRDPEGFVRDLERMVREQEAAIAVTLAHQGRRIAGVRAVLETDPFEAPRNRAPRGKRNPHVAAGRGQLAMLVPALQALRAFRQAYRQAYRDFVKGVKTLFPAGTFLLARVFGVRCESDQPLLPLALGRHGPVALA